MSNLKKLKNGIQRQGPLLLIIMDGVGLGKEQEGNAIWKANTPTIDWLRKNTVNTVLNAHGTFVGLPSDSDIGNSEVGHNALGSGQVVAQGAKLVNNAIESETIFNGKLWKKMIDRCLSNDKTLHLIGMVSDGNVHSHIEHIKALIKRSASDKIKKLRLHYLLDGRDVAPQSEPKYMQIIEKLFKEINDSIDFDYRIASGGGRMNVTMDRYEADWSIVERGWNAHVLGIGKQFDSAEEALNHYRTNDPSIQDQFLGEFVIVENGKPIGTIEDGDSVIFFNFRGDRAIEISKAFDNKDFKAFDRKRVPDVLFCGMLEYDGDQHIPNNYLVDPPSINNILSEYLVQEKIKQFAISETQKYGHVTYFWNGNRLGYIDEKYERYVEIKSDIIPFEQRPWMKAAEITDEIIKQLRSNEYKFLRLNYPNGDMVGHTGNYDATQISVSTVDLCLARILPVIKKLNGLALITADHGNADIMYKLDDKGNKNVVSAHTLNPVMFSIYDPNYNNEYKLNSYFNNNPNEKMGIANVTGTILNLLGFETPEMYRKSIIEFN